MPLICTPCGYQWAEPQQLPIDMGAWLKKFRKLKCPYCGASMKHLQIAFGAAAKFILETV